MPTQRSRNGEALDLPKLTNYLQQSVLEIGVIHHVEQFKNGFSNLTYRLDTDKGPFVLRRPPFGPRAKKAHDMAREFNVLSGIQPVFAKAPKVYTLCEDESILGAPFYLMECVEGEIIRHQKDQTFKRTAENRAQASEALIKTLAALHNVELSKKELITLGKPEGYVSRQVEGWIKRYEIAKTENVKTPGSLIEYLRSEQPEDHAGALIHNDYKFDNVVFSPEKYTEVKAVLDWEMCTIGHPLLDLGLTLAYWAHEEEVNEMPFLGMNATHLPGCFRRSELVSAYAKTSNTKTGDLLYPFVFGNFKIAGIVQQIYARFAAGHTKDPRFAQLHHVVNYLIMRAERAVSVGAIE